jgi:hypothetical protein
MFGFEMFVVEVSSGGGVVLPLSVTESLGLTL